MRESRGRLTQVETRVEGDLLYPQLKPANLLKDSEIKHMALSRDYEQIKSRIVSNGEFLRTNPDKAYILIGALC